MPGSAHDAKTAYWRFSGPLSPAAFAHSIGLIDPSSPAALAPAKAALMRGDVEQGKALLRQVVEAGAGDVTDDALVLLGCVENASWTDEGAQAAQQLLDEANAERQSLRAEAEQLRAELESLRVELAENRQRLEAARAAADPAPAASFGQTISLFPEDQDAQIRALQDRIRELEDAAAHAAAQPAADRVSDEREPLRPECENEQRAHAAALDAKEQLLNRQAAELTEQLERAQTRHLELDRHGAVVFCDADAPVPARAADEIVDTFDLTCRVGCVRRQHLM